MLRALAPLLASLMAPVTLMAVLSAPALAASEPGARHITTSPGYLAQPALHAPIRSAGRTVGQLQVSFGLEEADRAVVEQRRAWLRDGWNRALLGYASRQYAWPAVPDAQAIAALLQAETDRVLGPGRAIVLLDTVMIHAG
ncbi:hypothetical protein F1654_06505 [Alkalicaulis satelles]|uniref:Uncharacterized protein n=1 Tax=Alkalicaulis satelles TaxID=2609175 RepID=A0A5M6ZFC5_9PROT|nr:hypothetical protein [Alkalicaulis satelles]KAA5803453.1 hypothetical protein F1654_06505 [Alkalicaulis satelles]